MITDEKLTIYQKFRGDIDGWARAGTPQEKALMTDEDWADIDGILLRLAIVKSGRAADAYEAETRRILAATAESEGVAQRLRDCA
jgi:hypothetical protein